MCMAAHSMQEGAKAVYPSKCTFLSLTRKENIVFWKRNFYHVISPCFTHLHRQTADTKEVHNSRSDATCCCVLSLPLTSKFHLESESIKFCDKIIDKTTIVVVILIY